MRPKAAVAGGYPHLAVFAAADYARPNRYVIPPPHTFEPSWEVGVALTYVPTDSLEAAFLRREGAAQDLALRAELESLEQALLLEVSTAAAALLRAAEHRHAAHAAEVAATEAYDRRMAELRAGTVTVADLTAAEGDLSRARLGVLDALVERQLARARLTYALGETAVQPR